MFVMKHIGKYLQCFIDGKKLERMLRSSYINRMIFMEGQLNQKYENLVLSAKEKLLGNEFLLYFNMIRKEESTKNTIQAHSNVKIFPNIAWKSSLNMRKCTSKLDDAWFLRVEKIFKINLNYFKRVYRE